MKRILFITGTRADYGKVKPLIRAVEEAPNFEAYVFVCGMHLSHVLGNTYEEVLKDRYKNIYVAYGLTSTSNMSVNIGDTIKHLAGYVENILPDMIVVHGDRTDALAGAIVGALHNIFVAHIEGGELSGTIDESIRHAISKFAHIHFVCTQKARQHLIQMGEDSGRIYVIGSPDIDIMLGNFLPTIEEARKRYDVSFEHFAIVIYHPVTTEYHAVGCHIRTVIDALIASEKNYIVVYPNNDMGSEIILNEYKRLSGNKHFHTFPSIRFEYFLTFLKNAEFIIGNSSAGIREAGIYAVPTIDIGTRQQGRYDMSKQGNIQHVVEDIEAIGRAISEVEHHRVLFDVFGDGKSVERFMGIISRNEFWSHQIQKKFFEFDT